MTSTSLAIPIVARPDPEITMPVQNAKIKNIYSTAFLLGTGQNLMGAWGRCKRQWDEHFFYRFKAWGGYFFAVSGHGADTFFHYLETKEKLFTEKNCSCSYIFHCSSRQSLKCSCTYRSVLKKSDTARSSYYNEYFEQ